MFVIGFLGSILMTFSTAVGYAGYVPDTSANVLGVCMLIISSVGTVSQGLRERLKFRDVARIARRLSWKLQRLGVLFVARAAPYDATGMAAGETNFRRFVTDVEGLKSLADQQRMQLRETEEASATEHPAAERPATTERPGGRSAAVSPMPPAVELRLVEGV